MSDFKGLFNKLRLDLRRYGATAVSAGIDEIKKIQRTGQSAEPDEVEELMRELRGERAFPAMISVYQLFRHVSTDTSRLLYAQALIDNDQVHAGQDELEEMQSQSEGQVLSEVLGLLGRSYKQGFVSAFKVGNREQMLAQLAKSIECYETGYERNPAWHGANLAALLWRGEHEGLLGEGKAADLADRLLSDLPEPASSDPWDLAARAQAHMAREEWSKGAEFYRRYVDALRAVQQRSSLFVVHGDFRQLREMWIADRDDGSGRIEPLRVVERFMAEGVVGSSPVDEQEASEFGVALATTGEDGGRQLEALVAEGRYISSTELKRLQENMPCVGRIERRGGDPVGTGFLIDGRVIASGLGPLLVTCEHVVTDELSDAKQVMPSQARVVFEGWESQERNTFDLQAVIWRSRLPGHDISVVEVAGLPASACAARLAREDSPFARPEGNARQNLGYVHVIGYPLGRRLSLSFGKNDVLDHELHLGGRTPRVLHYRANTEHGSSGSPVLSEQGEVVAVHRAHVSNQIESSDKLFEGAYRANEGVGLSFALRACRASRRETR